MRLEKLTGFIVYSFPLGEADQILTCFTSAGNLVKFIAKGSRKVKSKFSASVQLWNLGEYVIYRYKGLPILRQADIVDSYSSIRRDWAKSGAAFAVMELCRLLIAEEAGEVQCFRLVFSYFHHLKENKYTSVAFDAFRMQFGARLGYEMSFDQCAVCGRAVTSAGLDWSTGGAVCCSNSPVRFGKEELIVLDKLSKLDFTQVSTLVTTPSIVQRCAQAVDSLIFWLTEGKTKAQAFRKMFEEGY